MNLHIALLEPEIPQNTGNIARTCAALGAVLHLIEPLGFSLSDRYLKRAGLDYWPFVQIQIHSNLDEFLRDCSAEHLYLASRRGKRLYTEYRYPDPCYFLLGKESTGLPQELLDRFSDRVVRIPTKEGVRSLNLSSAAAVLAYEYARQKGFQGF
ncbi:MAG: tRNA (cytidine(34)-2'-O)-methyltransferase [Spirochaetes bacterium]|nr:tRNA (cytidine(34)-2'-O)-methyltransferase [Spirochaetota bacterium]